MPRLATLPENATLIDLLKAYPVGARIIGPMVQEALRGPSPRSVQGRFLASASYDLRPDSFDAI